jgi:hypothetical protein
MPSAAKIKNKESKCKMTDKNLKMRIVTITVSGCPSRENCGPLCRYGRLLPFLPFALSF